MEVQAATTAAAVKRIYLIINCIILSIGNCGGPLIMRLYFIRGGKRIWFSSWLETGGWPIILIPLIVSYMLRRRTTSNTQLFFMKPRVFWAAAVIGTFTGLDDYLYAYGIAKLPVSTSSLLIATQLAFTAVFAFLLVKQKFTAYSINAVVLLTVGAVVLGLHASGDRPKGESDKQYFVGFFMTLGAAAMYGLILPLVELMYLKAGQALTYTLVLEIQTVMCFFATAFCTVGMLINKDFQCLEGVFVYHVQVEMDAIAIRRLIERNKFLGYLLIVFKAIPREAREYELGEGKYYLVVIWSAIIWQCFFLGAIGVIFYSSSLLSGIAITVLLPVTELLAVIFYHEKFQSEKGVSLFLSLWGFISYFLGEKVRMSKEKKNDMITESEMSNHHQQSLATP